MDRTCTHISSGRGEDGAWDESISEAARPHCTLRKSIVPSLARNVYYPESAPEIRHPGWRAYEFTRGARHGASANSFLIAVITSWPQCKRWIEGGTGIKGLNPRLFALVVIALAICRVHDAGMRAFMLANVRSECICPHPSAGLHWHE